MNYLNKRRKYRQKDNLRERQRVYERKKEKNNESGIEKKYGMKERMSFKEVILLEQTSRSLKKLVKIDDGKQKKLIDE